MDVPNIQSRVQTVLLMETTNEIRLLTGKLQVPALQSMLLLTTLIVTLPIWNSNPLISMLVYLLASTLVAIFIGETNTAVAENGDLYGVSAYTLMATALTAILKSLPSHVAKSVLLSRISFSLIYASASYISRVVLQRQWTGMLTCLLFASLSLLLRYLFQAPLKPPVILNALLKIMQQVLLPCPLPAALCPLPSARCPLEFAIVTGHTVAP